MNPTSDSPPSRPATPRSLLWRLLRFALLSLATLLVLVALAYAVENYRGWHAWSAESRALQERGIQTDYLAFAPPAVPDDRNFALLPVLQPMFAYDTTPEGVRWHDTNGFQKAQQLLSFGANWPGGDGKRAPSFDKEWVYGRPLDLGAWQSAFHAAERDRRESRGRPPTSQRIRTYALPETPGQAAADVLLALQTFREEFDTLATGIRQRPQARFAIRYEDDFAALLPHLALVKRSAGMFALRASTHLAAGHPAEALEDTRTSLLLAELPRNEPFLISQLVRLAALDLALQPVWEAQLRHAWTEPQWAGLQSQISALDPLPEVRRALDVERAAMIRVTTRMASSLAECRRYGSMLADFNSQGSASIAPWFETYLALAPRGWLYNGLTDISQHLSKLNDTTPPELAKLLDHWDPAATTRLSVRHLLSHAFFSIGIFNERLAFQLAKGVRGQVHVRLATIACALERHRLASGSYPEALSALTPRFLDTLPADPFTGHPPRYERDDAEHFSLWSVGLDGTDQGGLFPTRPEKGRFGDEAKSAGVPPGDWVWRNVEADF